MADSLPPTSNELRHHPIHHRDPEKQENLGILASLFPALRVDLVVAVHDEFGGSVWRTIKHLEQINNAPFINTLFIWGWEGYCSRDWDAFYHLYKHILSRRRLPS
ncbi:hypothetical protein E2P81_ATG03223 [Venturia nashicola]|nr:hypothetical protein E2P81_ATG03223 [Venturia nashicola]